MVLRKVQKAAPVLMGPGPGVGKLRDQDKERRKMGGTDERKKARKQRKGDMCTGGWDKYAVTEGRAQKSRVRQRGQSFQKGD